MIPLGILLSCSSELYLTWMHQIANHSDYDPLYWIIAIYVLGLYADYAGGRLFNNYIKNIFLIQIMRLVRGIAIWFGLAFFTAIALVCFPSWKSDELLANLPTIIGLWLIWKYPGVVEIAGIATLFAGSRSRKRK